MIDRIAAEAKEKSGRPHRHPVFPERPARLRQGHDGMVVSGALTMTTDGAAALGALLAAALGASRRPISGATPRTWPRSPASPLFAEAERGAGREARHAHAQPSPTTASAISPPATRRCRPSPTWPASSCACRRSTPSAPWPRPGARGDADQLQRALSRAEPGRRRRPGEPAADDRQRQAQRGAEVPGADRAHHHAAPGHRQRGLARQALDAADRDDPRRGDRRGARPGRTRSCSTQEGAPARHARRRRA